jgi:hypothetical protein
MVPEGFPQVLAVKISCAHPRARPCHFAFLAFVLPRSAYSAFYQDANSCRILSSAVAQPCGASRPGTEEDEEDAGDGAAQSDVASEALLADEVAADENDDTVESRTGFMRHWGVNRASRYLYVLPAGGITHALRIWMT